MKKYIIYLRRNLVNGKVYIGETKNFKQRENNWKCLTGPYANKHIDADRVEFGLENWKTEILAEADSRDEAFELEKRFIADYNSIYPNGYNISTGGYSNSGVKHSDEAKQKMSEAKKGENNYWYGMHHSEETKRKMSDVKPKKSVYQYTLDGVLKKVWPSVNECGRNGYNQGAVCACCRGKQKMYKGYRWSYSPIPL